MTYRIIAPMTSDEFLSGYASGKALMMQVLIREGEARGNDDFLKGLLQLGTAEDDEAEEGAKKQLKKRRQKQSKTQARTVPGEITLKYRPGLNKAAKRGDPDPRFPHILGEPVNMKTATYRDWILLRDETLVTWKLEHPVIGQRDESEEAEDGQEPAEVDEASVAHMREEAAQIEARQAKREARKAKLEMLTASKKGKDRADLPRPSPPSSSPGSPPPLQTEVDRLLPSHASYLARIADGMTVAEAQAELARANVPPIPDEYLAGAPVDPSVASGQHSGPSSSGV